MAKYERTFKGDFEEVVQICNDAVMNNSVSATFEDGSTYHGDGVSVSVGVYERYSAFGGNRVSMNITVIGHGEDLFLSAITSGGTQAVFWKILPIGEETFLNTLVPEIEEYIANHS